MNRINELTARKLVTQAERHGWSYYGCCNRGYLLSRQLDFGRGRHRFVTLIADRATMRLHLFRTPDAS